MKSIIKFGCSGEHNERNVYVYVHPSTFEGVTSVMNLTLLMDPKISGSFKKLCFGMTAITLYRSQLKISEELIPLVHSFPHLDIQLLGGFRESILTKLNLEHNGIWNDQTCISIGNFLATWLLETRLYKNVNETLQYYMQPYFVNLLANNLFYTGKKNLSRLEEINCPEILRFNDDLYNKVIQCVRALSHRYQNMQPTMLIVNDGKIITGCGVQVEPAELFNHPCFVVNMCIGKNLNVNFKDYHPKNPQIYDFKPIDNGQENLNWKENNVVSYCRLCKREYSMLQFALLCGVRCTMLENHFRNSNGVTKAITQNMTIANGLLPDINATEQLAPLKFTDYVQIPTGVLIAEIPYKKTTRIKNDKRVCSQLCSASGTF